VRDAADLGVGHSAEAPDFTEELALKDLIVAPPRHVPPKPWCDAIMLRLRLLRRIPGMR
jgi:hypothetical protein